MPVRSPQICNCSTAAARNVSPAASNTVLPSACQFCASLPAVVVFPEPLTPTRSTTCGRFWGSISSGLATGFKIASSPSAKASAIESASTGPSNLCAFKAVASRIADAVPRSAAISASSTSSNEAASSLDLPISADKEGRLASDSLTFLLDLLRPSFSFLNQFMRSAPPLQPHDQQDCRHHARSIQHQQAGLTE